MRIGGSILHDRVVPLLLLLCFVAFGFLSVRSSVAASTEEEIRVLANLPLKDVKVNQMFVQQQGGKYYLYLHQPAEDVYALVDVTKPDKPVLIHRSALKGSAPEGPVSESPLAITTTEEGEGAAQKAVELPTQTVNLVDLSNPKGLKTVKTFKGVTAMYSEDGRKLLYMVNGEGLWVVKHRNVRPVPLCGGAESGCIGP